MKQATFGVGAAFHSSSKPVPNCPDYPRAVAAGPCKIGRTPGRFVNGDREGVAFPDGTPTYDGVAGAYAAGMDQLTSVGDHSAQENEAKRGRGVSFAERAAPDGGRVNHAEAVVADCDDGAGRKIKAKKSSGFTAPWPRRRHARAHRTGRIHDPRPTDMRTKS